MGFTLTYDLEGAGWAMATLQDGEKRVEITVSYLHDSLRELAEAACAVMGGADRVKVIFMDEPGEVQIVAVCRGEIVDYAVRSFESWSISGPQPDDGYETLHSGTTTRARLVGEIRKELEAVLKTYGEEGYKTKWINAPFPIELLEELQRMGLSKARYRFPE